MRRLAIVLAAWMLGPAAAILSAQSLDDLNIQIHGYATQGFLYTTHNNIFTTNSSDGNTAWTEAVVNLSVQPEPKLRVGVQARYYLMGNLGNTIILDWANLDYKSSDKFGVRVGKVKTPWGLFNETQDIDPASIWVLLPQSVYPIESRESYLTHYGGVVYGKFQLGPQLGTLEYKGFGGESVYVENDGIFLAQNEAGYPLPNGIQGPIFGGALHWKPPVTGLMVGYSDSTTTTWHALITAQNGAISGTQTLYEMSQPNLFAIYEKKKIMLAGEACRNWTDTRTVFPGYPAISQSVSGRSDPREWYAMATYKLTSKLTAGVYDSQIVDHKDPLGPGRYQKDWTIAGRYDINGFLYAKVEQHFIQGTQLGYDATLNPNGLQPNTGLTMMKLGVSF
ncbi:MAG: hypothetical protein ABSD59_17005 [Terracidiphilus sp.]